MDTPFQLFRVAVYDPEDGTVYWASKKPVAARTDEAAKHKAIGELPAVLPEGVSLNELLDKVSILVRPF